MEEEEVEEAQAVADLEQENDSTQQSLDLDTDSYWAGSPYWLDPSLGDSREELKDKRQESLGARTVRRCILLAGVS